MFVSAAMAAYEPPLAGMPQMVMAMRREPTSRAALVATVKKGAVSNERVKAGGGPATYLRRESSPIRRQRWAGGQRRVHQGTKKSTHYAKATIHGADTGDAPKLVGSMHDQMTRPMMKSYVHKRDH